MGVSEARRLMPFLRANARATVAKLARMTDKVELITEIHMGNKSKESIEWENELNEWRAKILEIDQEYIFKGNESINKLKQIYERYKPEGNIAGKIEHEE